MRKIILIFVVLAVAVGLVWALGSDTPLEPVDVNDDNGEVRIEARLNTPFEVKNHTVTVWAVTEDSRCPTGVECVWAGRVKIALNVMSPSGPSTAEMEPLQTYTTETIAITLEKVSPYPSDSHKITDDEYRFHFTINDR